MKLTKKTKRVGPHTFDDFCFLVGDDQKADLIDGVIYMASPENTDANELFVWLITLMHFLADARGLGKVYGSRVAFRLDEKSAPEPDIGFVPKARLSAVQRGHVLGGPALAIEIVSPESVERDYEQKLAKYEEAGIHEYWIIDEVEEKVILNRLNARRKYREVKPKDGVLRSEAMPGFWLRPEWLWPPRPAMLDVLAQLLGIPPISLPDA